MSRQFGRLQGREGRERWRRETEKERVERDCFFLSELSVYAHVYLPKLRSQRDLQDRSLLPCILSVCVCVCKSAYLCELFHAYVHEHCGFSHARFRLYFSMCAGSLYNISNVYNISQRFYNISMYSNFCFTWATGYLAQAC